MEMDNALAAANLAYVCLRPFTAAAHAKDLPDSRVPVVQERYRFFTQLFELSRFAYKKLVDSSIPTRKTTVKQMVKALKDCTPVNAHATGQNGIASVVERLKVEPGFGDELDAVGAFEQYVKTIEWLWMIHKYASQFTAQPDNRNVTRLGEQAACLMKELWVHAEQFQLAGVYILAREFVDGSETVDSVVRDVQWVGLVFFSQVKKNYLGSLLKQYGMQFPQIGLNKAVDHILKHAKLSEKQLENFNSRMEKYAPPLGTVPRHNPL